METKLWLECFVDLFKLFALFAVTGCAWIAGYEARVKEERKYETPGNVRRARKRKLHY